MAARLQLSQGKVAIAVEALSDDPSCQADLRSGRVVGTDRRRPGQLAFVRAPQQPWKKYGLTAIADAGWANPQSGEIADALDLHQSYEIILDIGVLAASCDAAAASQRLC